MNLVDVDLAVNLGRFALANPILVGSGTFGYAREMAGLVDLGRLGGILPKTITQALPRNPPPRTYETSGGMLNSIGLDNDGIESFIALTLPYLAGLGTKILVSIAGKSQQEFVDMAARLDGLPGVDALELNISCPNVSGGVDFGTDPAMCEAVVAGVRKVCSLPVIAKLTPNVTDVVRIARAAEAGGCDAVALINTCLGMAINWRRRRSQLGRMMGGLSGPAIKPIALRAVFQAAQAVQIPIVGIGGIATIDDVMDFLVAGPRPCKLAPQTFIIPRLRSGRSMPCRKPLANSACLGSRNSRHANRRVTPQPISRSSSFILHPSSFILHPSSFILHPSSFILHPSSFILHPFDHATCSIRHPAHRAIPLGQRLWRDPPVHRSAGQARNGLLFHCRPARPDHGP